MSTNTEQPTTHTTKTQPVTPRTLLIFPGSLFVCVAVPGKCSPALPPIARIGLPIATPSLSVSCLLLPGFDKWPMDPVVAHRHGMWFVVFDVAVLLFVVV